MQVVAEESLATAPDAELHREVVTRLIEKMGGQRPRELVLIQPPLVPEKFFDVAVARRCGYYNFPPAGLLYLAAAAHEVDPSLRIVIIDLNHKLLEAAQQDGFEYQVWKSWVRDEIERCEAPLAAVTFMFGTTKPCFIDVSSFVREAFPKVPVLTGGVQATFDYKEILRDGLADFVALKEGEGQLQDLLRSLIAGAPVAIPKGSAVLDNGKIVELGQPAMDARQSWDIRPYYDLIDVASYYKYGGLGAFSRFVGADKSYATVLGRRGCRARCTFCTVRNFNGLGIRIRETQDIIDEIKHLVEEKGVDYIDWLDDDLLFDREQVIAMFKGLAEQVPGLQWTASNGLIGVAIDEEVMDWMVRSGLQAYKIGIESGNDKMLKVIKKPTTKLKLRQRKALFTKHPHVLFSGNFIIGFPNETFGQMLDTYNFGVELESDWASFYICQPLRGTEMFSAFQALGDDRCEEERYDKTINPGRSAERCEFGYKFEKKRDEILTGWDIFNLPRGTMPSLEQQKEIWFTFNFVANFLNNPNLRPGGNAAKLIKWLLAIHDGYPYDASMAAALSHCYLLAGDMEAHHKHRTRFLELTRDSSYWQTRCHQFPELFVLAGVETPPEWFRGTPAKSLTRQLPEDVLVRAA